MGVLLHPADRLRDRHPVPLLLDVHHRHPTRRRALPVLAGGQQCAVLDAGQPTLDHFRDLLAKTTFPQWLWNTFFIAVVSTVISLFCGLLAGYALARLKFPMAGFLGTSIFVTYLVPPTLLFIPLADIIRNFQLGNTPWALILTYPTFLIPFCTWLLMGYFKTIPKELEECARIDGATRFGAMMRIIFPIAVPGHPVGGHLRVHAVVERVHLRAGLPVVAGAEDGAGGRGVRADPRRHLLLGPADGRRAARLDPGGPRLFLLRGVLRHRADRLGEGLNQ